MHTEKEIEIRGKILALSLPIEDCLSRIIFNFFLPQSRDQKTRNKFLEMFVLNLTLGGKNKIYQEILKLDRYREKVRAELKDSPMVLKNKTVKDFKTFKNTVQTNLNELIRVRNNIVHGSDMSKGFLTLENDEMVFANKLKMIKITKDFMADYTNLTSDTFNLLEITNGRLQAP